MMGKDVERILAELEAVKEATIAMIKSLADRTAYQLVHYGPHDVVLIPWNPPCYPLELEHPAGDSISTIIKAMDAMKSDFIQMDKMKGNMYTGAGSLLNGIEAPWIELEHLQREVNDANLYHATYAPFNYVGEKAGMLSLLNMIHTAVVDAEWVIVIYHDWIQRGYDFLVNGKSPSITWKDSVTGRQTIGNVPQSYSENVSIGGGNSNPY